MLFSTLSARLASRGANKALTKQITLPTRRRGGEIIKETARAGDRQILDRAGFSYLAANAMAAVAAPYHLSAALAESTHGAGGAQMDPRAPASAVEVVFREFTSQVRRRRAQAHLALAARRLLGVGRRRSGGELPIPTESIEPKVRAPAPNRASVYRHTSKFKGTPR